MKLVAGVYFNGNRLYIFERQGGNCARSEKR